MLIIYTFPGSVPCQKKRQQLREDHIPFVERNLFSNCLKDAEIQYLILRSGNGALGLIRSPEKIKKLTGKEASKCSRKEWIRLIRKNPSLLDVPIVLSSDSLSVGWHQEEMDIEIHLENLLEEDEKPVLCCCQTL